MTVVIAVSPIEQTAFLPGPARYRREVFEPLLGNEPSVEKGRLSLRLIKLPNSHGSTYLDKSKLVRVGPSRESECLGILLDRLFDRGTFFWTDLSLEWFASAPERFPLKHGRPA